MAIETLQTPKGWTPIACQTEDSQDAENVTEYAKISGTEMYYQVMRQSGLYTPPEYESTRWYLIAFMLHSNGSMTDVHCYSKDSANQPAFPAAFTSTSGGTGSSTPTTMSKIEQIQAALNAKYAANLTVDGKWGPNTCSAALAYQKNIVGISGSSLTTGFFSKLGLPTTWATEFKSSCASSSGGGDAPVPPPPPPVPESTFPWMYVLLGAAGGSLIGLAGKKTVLKRSKVKPAVVGIGGALAGAVGGYLYGRNR